MTNKSPESTGANTNRVVRTARYVTFATSAPTKLLFAAVTGTATVMRVLLSFSSQ